MMLTGLPPVQAPTTTGHPASLPSLQLRKDATTRVEPSAKGGETAGTSLRKGQTPPHAQTTRRADRPDKGNAPKSDGNPASAPPTILQLKIGEMLREQAEASQDMAVEDDVAADKRVETADHTADDAHHYTAAAKQAALPEAPQGTTAPDIVDRAEDRPPDPSISAPRSDDPGSDDPAERS